MRLSRDLILAVIVAALLAAIGFVTPNFLQPGNLVGVAQGGERHSLLDGISGAHEYFFQKTRALDAHRGHVCVIEHSRCGDSAVDGNKKTIRIPGAGPDRPNSRSRVSACTK